MVYAVLGTVKQVSIGPTALLALLTHQYAQENPSITALLSFISGAVCILFGFLNLGILQLILDIFRIFILENFIIKKSLQCFWLKNVNHVVIIA